MSVVDTHKEAREMAGLLKEYTKNLEEKNEELLNETQKDKKPPKNLLQRKLWDKRKEFRKHWDRLMHLLACSASQLLEHADLPVSTEIELKLRLGEFEYQYFKFKTLIQA